MAKDPGKQKQPGWQSGPLILLFIIIPLSCAWVWMLAPQWQAAGVRMQEIPFSLHAASPADYSVRPQQTLFPAVEISILNDVLRDREPDAQDIDKRVAVVVDQLRTPVPTATGILSAPDKKTRAPAAPTPGSSTSAATLAPTPVLTVTLPMSSATSKPPAPTRIAPLPTQPPTDIPEPNPTRTATRKPTATYTITPTATETQTATPTATEVVILTESPTPTATEGAPDPPTETPTATEPPTGCIPPDPSSGYVVGVVPENGSSNVPVHVQPVILFNQAMDPASLTYGDNRHILLEICFEDTCQLNFNLSGNVSVSSQVYENDQVTILPDDELVPGATYRITVGNQVQNAAACNSRNQGVRVYYIFTTAP